MAPDAVQRLLPRETHTHTRFFENKAKPGPLYGVFICAYKHKRQIYPTQNLAVTFSCALLACAGDSIYIRYHINIFLKIKKIHLSYKYIFKIITRIMTMKRQTMNKRKRR